MRKGNWGSNHTGTPEAARDHCRPDPHSPDPRNPDPDSHNPDFHSPDSDPHSRDSRSLDFRTPVAPAVQLGHLQTVQPTSLFPIMLRLLRFSFDSSLEPRSCRTTTPIARAIGLPNHMARRHVISWG